MISYKKLLYLLIDRGIKLTHLVKECGLSSNIVTRINRNQSVELKSLEKICLKLGVNIGDVCDILPDQISSLDK
jgi:DNA-binding Xre family transcriptional regulator